MIQKRFLYGAFLLTFLSAMSYQSYADYPSFNQHAVFDGASYISVPYSTSLNYNLSMGGSFTIDAWVYPTSFSSYPTVVGNDYSFSYWLGFNTAGNIRFYPGNGVYRESNGTVPLNKWTHIAVSYNYYKSEARFYINNTLDRVASNFSAPIGMNQMDLRIGADRQGGSPSYYFSGSIDEVRIWRTEIDFPGTDGALYKIPQQYAGGEYGTSLVSAWRLNGNGADSVSNNNGTNVGLINFISTNNPPHYQRICAVLPNNAGENLDDFVIPHSSSISLTNNYTLECWVNLFAAGGSTTYQTFINKGYIGATANVLTYWLGVNKQNGKLRFIPNGNWNTPLESIDPLPINQWVHVAGRFSFNGNTGTATVFINGVARGSGTYTSAATANTLSLLIGTSDEQRFTPYALSGKIDEVRIWNAVRTDAEIGNNYRYELDGPLSNLVACYHFNGDVLDLSGFDNHGNNINYGSTKLYFQDASDLPSFPTLTITSPIGGENWLIGTPHAITWSSSGLTALKIELSRDGGASFTETLIDPIAASLGNYNWNATGPQTTKARIRISTSTSTPISSTSPSSFKITEPPPHIALYPQIIQLNTYPGVNPPMKYVKVRNTSSGMLNWNATSPSLWMVMDPRNGVQDDSVGISANVSGLGMGTYNGVVNVSGNADNSPEKIQVQLVISTFPLFAVSGKVIHDTDGLAGIVINGSGDSSFTINTISDGTFTIGGLRPGSYILTPTSAYYNFTPPVLNITNLNAPMSGIVFRATAKPGNATLHFKQGWNLISLPIDPTTHDVATLFPAAEAPARAYRYSQDSGYISETNILFGIGYWIKFTRDDSVVISGILRGDFNASLKRGSSAWNMIGGASGIVPLLSIVQNPPGSIIAIYEFDPVVGYRLPPGDLLLPGKGFFIKVFNDVSLGMFSSFTGSRIELDRALKLPSSMPDILVPPLPPKK